MLQESHHEPEASSLEDTASTYGWVSIAVHWLTAVVVIALWFLGQRIESAGSGDVDARRALHVSIAASIWLVLLFRIAWRVRSGHPKVRGLSERTHLVAKWAHYAMLLLLAIMLLSGPLMVWGGGQPVRLFETLSVPAPFGESESLEALAHTLHAGAARGLVLLVLIHVGAAMKHLMFHADDSIVRMLWPVRDRSRG